MNSLPSYFVIGVAKSATTFLFEGLKNSEEIATPIMKEPSFLVYNGNNNYVIDSYSKKLQTLNFSKNISDYKNNFKKKHLGTKIGDYSTHYFYFLDKFIESMKKYYGDDYSKIPIIVMLRCPIKRAFSHYSMKVRDQQENKVFLEAIKMSVIERRLKENYLPSFDYIGFSRYKKKIKKLQETFENILLVDFEMIKVRPNKLLENVTNFLNIKRINVPINRPINQSGSLKKNYLSNIVYKIIYRRNILKDLIPGSLKASAANTIKSKLHKVVFNKMEITFEEIEYLESILGEEIDFYELLFKD